MDEKELTPASVSVSISFNFIRGFVRLLQGTEVPEVFAMWSAIAAISCALGRRVWLPMQLFTLYPNLYIVFVAPPGGGKTTAIEYISDKIFPFLTPPPNLIPESGSAEAMIKSMKTTSTEASKTILKENCTGYLIAEELVTFLNEASYKQGMGKFLTKMYNCPSIYEHSTIGRGDDTLHNVCFGLVGGTTIDWLKQTLPDVAVGGGLTSRMIFIYNDILPKPHADPSETMILDHKEVLQELIKRLQEISELKGEFKKSDNAWSFYKQEYNHWRDPSHPWASDSTLAGYWRRRMNHFLKLGMIFAAAERNDLMIQLNHFVIAKNILEVSEENMKRVLDLITSTKEGSDAEMIYRAITGSEKGLLEATLLQLFGHKLGARELRDACDTLEKAGKIKSRIFNGTSRGYWVDRKEEKVKK